MRAVDVVMLRYAYGLWTYCMDFGISVDEVVNRKGEESRTPSALPVMTEVQAGQESQGDIPEI